VPGSYFWSSEVYRIFGVDPGTPVTLELFYSHVHPEEREAMQARRVQYIERAGPFQSQYRIVRSDESVRVLDGWLNFERAADGKTTRVFGTVQDVTERKHAEMEIHRARAQLQLVADTTPALIARFDCDRRLVWANKSFAARLDKTPDELVGSRLGDLVDDAVFQVIAPYCARVLAGELVHAELEVPYASGPRWLHVAAAPTPDVDGWVVVLPDVTDGRRLEQERERALNDLREVDRRKDEFLAMLSHELRNPLGPILNAVEVLERLAPGDEEIGARSRDIIARQAKHMKRLLDDLLDVSRVSQAKIQLQKQRVDLNVVLGQAVEVSRAMMIEKRHGVSLTLAPQPMALEADPTRLLQVFDNLLNNASTPTPVGISRSSRPSKTARRW
jgi:PAS domain S-box-containing protein